MSAWKSLEFWILWNRYVGIPFSQPSISQMFPKLFHDDNLLQPLECLWELGDNRLHLHWTLLQGMYLHTYLHTILKVHNSESPLFWKWADGLNNLLANHTLKTCSCLWYNSRCVLAHNWNAMFRAEFEAYQLREGYLLQVVTKATKECK